MKERFVLPKEIEQQVLEFINLMEAVPEVKRQAQTDESAKAKLMETVNRLDMLCASLAAYYQSQATRWSERRTEIKKMVLEKNEQK